MSKVEMLGSRVKGDRGGIDKLNSSSFTVNTVNILLITQKILMMITNLKN